MLNIVFLRGYAFAMLFAVPGSAADLDASLSCFQCQSKTSIDDCVKVQKAQECDAGWDRCGTLDLQYPNMVPYRKGCVTEELCQTFCLSGPDGEVGSEHCKLSCCQGNFCN